MKKMIMKVGALFLSSMINVHATVDYNRTFPEYPRGGTVLRDVLCDYYGIKFFSYPSGDKKCHLEYYCDDKDMNIFLLLYKQSQSVTNKQLPVKQRFHEKLQRVKEYYPELEKFGIKLYGYDIIIEKKGILKELLPAIYNAFKAHYQASLEDNVAHIIMKQ